MGSHFREICQYGIVHAQCRCASPAKTATPVVCDRPAEHRPSHIVDDEIPLPPEPDDPWNTWLPFDLGEELFDAPEEETEDDGGFDHRIRNYPEGWRDAPQ